MGLLNARQPQKRKASQAEQAQYTTLVKQVLGFIAKPEVRDTLKQMTEQMGAEKALAAIVSQALQLVGKAAEQAGAKVAVGTGLSALKEIVTVLTTMMASAGKIEDVGTAVDRIMEMVMGGGRAMPQQQPPMPPQGMPQAMGA